MLYHAAQRLFHHKEHEEHKVLNQYSFFVSFVTFVVFLCFVLKKEKRSTIVTNEGAILPRSQ